MSILRLTLKKVFNTAKLNMPELLVIETIINDVEAGRHDIFFGSL